LGFCLAHLFIFGLDKVLPHLHINFKETEGIKSPWQRTTLLVLAITLHNIPEGLAVGVLFGGVAAGIPKHQLLAQLRLPSELEFKIFQKELQFQCHYDEWE
jgi:ZIP family zinc transporter